MRVIFEAVEVHPQTLFDSDGDVRRWMTQLSAEMKVSVKAHAPPNRSRARWGTRPGTGELQRSIRADTQRSGPLQNVSTVFTTSDHARYVLGGTAYQGLRYIYTTEGYANKELVDRIASRVARGGRAGDGLEGLYMRLPLTGVGGRRRFHLRVHGQRANNFLFDGYNDVARKHPALGVLRNPYAF